MAAELGFIFWSFDRKRNIPISKLKYRGEFPWLNAIVESYGRQQRLIVLRPCFQRAKRTGRNPAARDQQFFTAVSGLQFGRAPTPGSNVGEGGGKASPFPQAPLRY